ncbi:malonic semialdehyde reductase [Rhodococcus erythropolis]
MTIPTVGALDEQAMAVLFSDARTANNFASTPVSDDELASIWHNSRWAPTAANSQPLRVMFVRSEGGKRRLLHHIDEGNRAKTESAPVTAILAVDTAFHEYLPHLLPIRPQMRDVFDANNELRERTGRFNSALQAGYFILAIRAAGLVAGPMAGFDQDGLDAEFLDTTTWKSILVINIGHPGANPWFDRLPRLELSETVCWA